MKPIKTILVDDEPEAIEVLKMHLKNVPFVKVMASFRDAMDAFSYVQNHQVDLIFLDINMPKLSGIKFTKLVKNSALIIFTTAYSSYAIEGYELNVVDYLLKPIEFERLLQSIMKAKEKLEIQVDNLPKTVVTSPKFIYVKSGSETHKLAIDDITYIESDRNYVTFHTNNKSILARYKLSEVLTMLSKDKFIRIHRSYVVSLNHLDVIKKHCVMIGQKEIPISSQYRKAFSDFINL